MALLASSGIDGAGGPFESIETPADLPEGPLRDAWGKHTPGLLIAFEAMSGRVAHQFRPDRPATVGGKLQKYLWLAGESLLFAVPDRAAVADVSLPLVLCEGTKQHLAVAAAAAGTLAVVGMFGCWGWRTSEAGGRPLPDFEDLPIDGRPVVVMLDADMTTNRRVWEAASRLGEHLRVCGAGSVKFARVPGDGKDGIDDVLGRLPAHRRARALQIIIDGAKPTPGDPPAIRSKYVTKGNRLRVDAMAGDLVKRFGPPALVGQEQRLAFHIPARGIYATDLADVRGWISAELGDDWSVARRDSVLHYLEDHFRRPDSGAVELPDLLPWRYANFANGVLRLTDGVFWSREELEVRGSKLPTTLRFEVDWDPEATCPEYDLWSIEKLVEPERIQLRDEVFGSAFDLGSRPDRHLIMEGPSHTGKSTELHLITAAVGDRLTTELDPAKLPTHRFIGAGLVGRRLAMCADLERIDLVTVGMLKRISNGDRTFVEQKGVDGHDIRPQALLLFATNDFPRLPGESSRAFSNRFSALRYTVTHAGAEDRDTEHRLLAELPGIVARWVKAYMEQLARGTRPAGFADDQIRMAGEANDVARFLHERCRACDRHDGVGRGTWWAAFRAWFESEYEGTRRQMPTKGQAFRQLEAAGFPTVRVGPKLMTNNGLALQIEGVWSDGLGRKPGLEPAGETGNDDEDHEPRETPAPVAPAKPRRAARKAAESAGLAASPVGPPTRPSSTSATSSLLLSSEKERREEIGDTHVREKLTLKSGQTGRCAVKRCPRDSAPGSDRCLAHEIPDTECAVCSAPLTTPLMVAMGQCMARDTTHQIVPTKLSPGYTHPPKETAAR